jgi:hypothetical protein
MTCSGEGPSGSIVQGSPGGAVLHASAAPGTMHKEAPHAWTRDASQTGIDKTRLLHSTDCGHIGQCLGDRVLKEPGKARIQAVHVEGR